MIDLSIIIVNYNVKEYLEKALLSIYEASVGIGKEIFVVDNDSSDGSCEIIKEKFKEVLIIENSQNVGFSKANNIALKRCSGRYILLINPDTIVNTDTIHKMVDFFDKTPDCGAAGCKILNPDRSLQLACRRGFPSPFTSFSKIIGLSKLFPKSKLFGKYNLTYLDPDQISTVDSVSGAFMMVRREILNDVGYLDEDFFLYGEDLDWCYRIGKKGWKIYYYPKTEIIHFKGRSSLKNRVEAGKEFYGSMKLFVEKHFKTRYFNTLLWFIKLGIGMSSGLFFFKKILKKILHSAIKLLSENFQTSKSKGKVLMVNSNKSEMEIYQYLKDSNIYDNNFAEIFNISRNTFGNEKLQDEMHLRKIIEKNRVNNIVISSDNIMPRDILKIMNVCSGLKIKFEFLSMNFN